MERLNCKSTIIQGYGGTREQVTCMKQGPSGGGDPLPFTGLDVGLWVVVGLLLVLLGYALRRTSSRGR